MSPAELELRRLRKNLHWSLHQIRVYRDQARKEPAVREFWFDSAHEEAKRARIIKAAIRAALRTPGAA